MKMNGEQALALPRSRVWDALNDLEVLKYCIPGCQSLERESAERLSTALMIKMGPIGARFAGFVTLSDIDPLKSYTLTMEGQGGAAGFVNSRVRVSLADDADTTLLTYEVDAKVGGRLAQLGGPLIAATAKQFANTFFKRLAERVENPQSVVEGQ